MLEIAKIFLFFILTNEPTTIVYIICSNSKENILVILIVLKGISKTLLYRVNKLQIMHGPTTFSPKFFFVFSLKSLCFCFRDNYKSIPFFTKRHFCRNSRISLSSLANETKFPGVGPAPNLLQYSTVKQPTGQRFKLWTTENWAHSVEFLAKRCKALLYPDFWSPSE